MSTEQNIIRLAQRMTDEHTIPAPGETTASRRCPAVAMDGGDHRAR